MSVAILLHRLGQSLELRGVDPALAERDFLRAGDFQSLALLDRRDELAGVEQAVVGAGVEPGVAAPQRLHLQPALLEVDAIDVGDLQLAARRRLECGGDVDHVVVVEVQPGDREVALRLARLLLDADRASRRVELDHAVALGVEHVVGEHRRARAVRVGGAQLRLQIVAPEQVVAQHQAARARADEIAADAKRLRQSVGRRLHRVLQVQAPLAAVAQQLGEARRVLRRRDDQHVAHAGQHQRGQRVIDHRLVVHRQQLLAHRLRHRVKPRARSSSEDQALARRVHGIGLM